MPIRRSPNGAAHTPPQTGRNRPEWVVAINRNAWSQSIGTGGRNHPDCAGVSDEFYQGLSAKDQMLRQSGICKRGAQCCGIEDSPSNTRAFWRDLGHTMSELA